MADLAVINSLKNVTESNPKFNERADMNFNGKIDEDDIDLLFMEIVSGRDK